MKILVIDDEEDIRRIVQLSLARVGKMEVVQASDGKTGAELAIAEKPDAILLDVMMPGIDGPQTLELLRSNEESAEIPVIFLTAKAQSSEIERLKGLGVKEVVTKPFDPMTLAEQVRQILG